MKGNAGHQLHRLLQVLQWVAPHATMLSVAAQCKTHLLGINKFIITMNKLNPIHPQVEDLILKFCHTVFFKKGKQFKKQAALAKIREVSYFILSICMFASTSFC